MSARLVTPAQSKGEFEWRGMKHEVTAADQIGAEFLAEVIRRWNEADRPLRWLSRLLRRKPCAS